MLVDPTDHIGKKLAAGSFYERDLLEDARMRMGPGLVIDVGAHVGNHTVWFGAICKRRVVALEPNPASNVLLLENVAANAVSAMIIRSAAGASSGRARIASTSSANSGMTRFIADSNGEVAVITVDSLRLKKVALLKIDVEGSEVGVLQGAEKTLGESKPLVYVEAASHESKQGVDAFLEPFGYRCIGEFCRTPTWGYQA